MSIGSALRARPGSGGAAAGPRRLALGANAVLALSIVLLPWYALAAYTPTGWQATWWARAAMALAILHLALVRLERRPAELLASSLAAVALVTFRVAVPPDFGFDFDGLEVPVERRFGGWVALAASVAGALSAALDRAAAGGAGRPAALG